MQRFKRMKIEVFPSYFDSIDLGRDFERAVENVAAFEGNSVSTCNIARIDQTSDSKQRFPGSINTLSLD